MKELFDLEEAHKRGGEASEQRPDAVATLLEETETLGYQQGEPLGNVDSYNAYPAEPEEFYQPQTGSLLQSIADSDAVHDLIDLGEELDMLVYKEGAGATTLQSAVDLHGISLPASVPDHVKEDSTIQVPDGEGGTLSITKEAPDWPTAYHLYVVLGLSVDEMASVLDVPYNEVYSPLSDYNMV
ncbi:hypothetical protein KU306_14435 [Haloferax larsenii]|uniref:Uncharacterized protein n=1 Tax=Haloferax larsenii TaxID=302484 RepID=A0ABY5RCJ8_HALLR|nr:hypothetical protein [Haloferax larsenii]UVE50086.1 hypothetical protein KU306_14435 [Haloferax larsenii]